MICESSYTVTRAKTGMSTRAAIKADPTKKLPGKITEIANVGEQRPNQDSKVFEVKIDVAKADTTLRPGMTTSNAIEVASIPNVLMVPLEAVTTLRAIAGRGAEGPLNVVTHA